jgi:hypothetical protein
VLVQLSADSTTLSEWSISVNVEIERIGEPLRYYPVLHACGHYEARFCGYSDPEGFLRAGSPCSQCDAQGRSVQEHFPTLEAVRAHCDKHNVQRNAYELRQEARRERLAAAAEKTRRESQALLDGAHTMAGIIPFGQPILAGHHSEKRDRRFRGRIASKTRKGFELSKKAEELERRAESVGSGGISSDDPEAIEKLRAELAKVEAAQERMKNANKCVRRNDRAGLAALGFSERHIGQLFTPDFAGRLGFPDYAITNNGANARRIRQRIEELEKRAQTPTRETIVGDGWTISDDAEENRIVIRFAAKPSREMLDKLRSCGFKWSPTRGAHVRMRSNGAWYDAGRVLGVNV